MCLGMLTNCDYFEMNYRDLTVNFKTWYFMISLYRHPTGTINRIIDQFVLNRMTVIWVIGRLQGASCVGSCAEGTANRYLSGNV